MCPSQADCRAQDLHLPLGHSACRAARRAPFTRNARGHRGRRQDISLIAPHATAYTGRAGAAPIWRAADFITAAPTRLCSPTSHSNISEGIPGTEMPGLFHADDRIRQIIAYIRSLTTTEQPAGDVLRGD